MATLMPLCLQSVISAEPSNNSRITRPSAASNLAAIISTGLFLTSESTSEASLILDLPHEVPFEISTLQNPDRLVIDLPKVAFPAKKVTTVAAGPVQAVRYGLFMMGQSRIILELSSPAAIDRIDFVPGKDGVRLVAAIKRSTAEAFEIAAKESSASVRYTGAVKNTPKDASHVDFAQANPVVVTNITKLPLIVIDPGHGGIDPGAAGPNGEIEKTLVLAVAQFLREKLVSSGKVRVELTRDSDVFVSLPDRVRLARSRSADLFISLHADTLTEEPHVRGATIYTLADRASDAASARLAEKENKADQVAGLDPGEDKEVVNDILFDLARRETRVFSLSFAKTLVAALQTAAPVNKNPHRYAGFRVLKAPDVPSVLLELGYLSSVEDAKQLNSPEWQQEISKAASEAILQFISTRSGRK